MDAGEKVDILTRAKAFVQHNAQEPAHEGSCGPEAGCDGLCVDSACDAELILDLSRFIDGLIASVGEGEIIDVRSTKIIIAEVREQCGWRTLTAAPALCEAVLELCNRLEEREADLRARLIHEMKEEKT